MKKNLYRLYYLFIFGGWYYVWVGIANKLLGHEKARKFLHNKTRKTNPKKYEAELTKIYALKTGKKLDLKNPSTFNEKLQWLKLNDATPLKTTLTDKFLVREWIRDKIGEQYLIPLLGVWDKFEDIKMSELPDSFVLKANHGSEWNVVVQNREEVNWNKVQKNFDEWMSYNFAFIAGFQMQYLNIPPKIIAEKYIKSADGNLYDYKIHCFNGKPEYIHVIGNRKINAHQAKEAFYDTAWVLQPFISGVYSKYETEIKKPAHLKEMLRIAEILSREFIYVRIDLYELDSGEIKFGEMTFTPGSGFYHWTPPETDRLWGEKIRLPL